MTEIKRTKLQDFNQREYLQGIKEELEKAKEEQIVIRNKIRHYTRVLYGGWGNYDA